MISVFRNGDNKRERNAGCIRKYRSTPAHHIAGPADIPAYAGARGDGGRSGPTVKPRLNYSQVDPQAVEGLRELEQRVRQSGLERSLLELVRLRASQINGCAYCIDMHTKDARLEGETEQRLYAVSAWAETPFYTERERAALAWTEAVTLISQHGVPDALYEEARRHFSDKELVDLTVAVIAINSWNRLSITFRTVPGSYQPRARQAAGSDR